MSETKKGIVTLVASSKGIKLEGEDDYYNPIGKCKEYVKTEMKGKEVELTLLDNDDHKFAFIKVIGGESVPKEKETKPEAKTDWDLKNKRDYRAMSISYAKDIAIARINKGENVSTNEMMIEADKFHYYIMNGLKE